MAATIKDIARETGLSLATISKYLNGGSLREKNRVAIEDAIKKLDYHVNEYARGLKSKKSRTVGMVLPELANLFNMKIVSTIEQMLQKHGYSVIICDSQNSLEQEARSVEFLLNKQVDGIINIPMGNNSKHLRPAVEHNVPILLLDRPLEDLSTTKALPGGRFAGSWKPGTAELGLWLGRREYIRRICAYAGIVRLWRNTALLTMKPL